MLKRRRHEAEDSRDAAFRNVFALGFTSFSTDVSSEMILGILLLSILGLPRQSEAVLGMMKKDRWKNSISISR